MANVYALVRMVLAEQDMELAFARGDQRSAAVHRGAWLLFSRALGRTASPDRHSSPTLRPPV